VSKAIIKNFEHSSYVVGFDKRRQKYKAVSASGLSLVEITPTLFLGIPEVLLQPNK
jgi:hypothetical protein